MKATTTCYFCKRNWMIFTPDFLSWMILFHLGLTKVGDRTMKNMKLTVIIYLKDDLDRQSYSFQIACCYWTFRFRRNWTGKPILSHYNPKRKDNMGSDVHLFIFYLFIFARHFDKGPCFNFPCIMKTCHCNRRCLVIFFFFRFT